MNNETILEISNLSVELKIGDKIYRAVDRLTFSLKKRKILAIVGESGSGKTMTALSILRILSSPPVVNVLGKILYRDKDLLQVSEKEMRKIRGKNIAMIFQDPMSALNPVYTIGSQLLETIDLHLDLSEDEAQNLMEKTLKEAGIANPQQILNSYPHQLSGGLKQRVLIAMALLCDPDVLIADEPTTALDATIQAQVLELIKSLQDKKHMAVLLITHDIGVVAEMAEEVIVMYAAQIMEKGSVLEVFENPSHPYTMGLFNSRIDLAKEQKTLVPIKGMVPSLTNYPSGCRFHPRCPYVMEKCRQGEVPDFDMSETHYAKCWLHDGSKESSEKLKHVYVDKP